jgi:trigger factor
LSRQTNMSISVETVSNIQRKLTITIPAADISVEVDKKLNELKGQVSIKGFRKGKVPPKVIKERYAGSARLDAINALIQSSYSKALDDEKLKPAGMPEIDPGELKEDGDITYVATLEVFPEIELADFSKLEIEKLVAEIGDEDVKNAVEKVRQQRAKWEESEEAIATGDRLNISYKATADGEDIDAETKDDVNLTVGDGIMLAGFEDGLVGAKAKAERSLTIKLPEDYSEEAFKGKEAIFTVTINKVEKHHLPEVDEEFIKSIGVEGGMEKLDEEVKKNLSRELKYLMKSQVKKLVFEKLSAAHSFDVPKAIITQEAERMKDQSLQYIKSMNANMPEMPDFPLDMFLADAEKQARTGLMLAEVIEQKKLKADEDKIEEHINDMASMYDEVEQAKTWIKGNKQQLEQIRSQVVEDQIVDLVLNVATVTEKQVSYDDLAATASR